MSCQLTIFPFNTFVQRESLVRELVLSLTMAGRERDALDELELCGSLIFFTFFFTTTKKKKPNLAIQIPSITSVPRQFRLAYVRRTPLFTTCVIYG